MTWAYVLAFSIIGFVAIGLIFSPMAHRWLVKHRWAVGKWE